MVRFSVWAGSKFDEIFTLCHEFTSPRCHGPYRNNNDTLIVISENQHIIEIPVDNFNVKRQQ